jgi:hypothetical protein
MGTLPVDRGSDSCHSLHDATRLLKIPCNFCIMESGIVARSHPVVTARKWIFIIASSLIGIIGIALRHQFAQLPHGPLGGGRKELAQLTPYRSRRDRNHVDDQAGNLMGPLWRHPKSDIEAFYTLFNCLLAHRGDVAACVAEGRRTVMECPETSGDSVVGLRLSLICFALGPITWHFLGPQGAASSKERNR